ncbi:MAG: methylated-DNA--[protein]-cysteine S-methyltransferase [Candidatus Cryptobacteroides sp.]
MQYIRHYDSPLGGIVLSSDGDALTGLWFEGQRHFGSTLDGERANVEEEIVAGERLTVLDDACRWLEIYFSGKAPDFTPKLSLLTTHFRKRVCEIIQAIPFGKTMTYGEIAEAIASERGLERMSARAVGAAVGHNPISLIIPCYRVLGADGKLTGYAGGLDRKVKLLQLEGNDFSQFTFLRHC